MSLVDYNRFASKLCLQVIKNSEKFTNLVISPLSIQTALGLAYIAAEGKTADEIRNGLHFTGKDKSDIENYFERNLAETKNDNVLMLNKIYVQKAFPVDKSYCEKAAKHFLSEVENADFDDVAAVVLLINEWIAKVSNNEIRSFLDESFVSPDINLMLVNTIKVEGKWMVPFQPQSIATTDFYINETDTIPVDMMSGARSGGVCDIPELDASALLLKCSENSISMFWILPNERTGLKEIEEKIEDIDISKLVENMQRGFVSLVIPKFKAEVLMDMESVLKNMGMPTMFSSESQLPGISSGAKLHISKVLHKAVIEVNEFGLSANTGRDAKMPRMCCPIKGVFRAYHPFWFAIRHGETILMSGRYTGQ